MCEFFYYAGIFQNSYIFNSLAASHVDEKLSCCVRPTASVIERTVRNCKSTGNKRHKQHIRNSPEFVERPATVHLSTSCDLTELAKRQDSDNSERYRYYLQSQFWCNCDLPSERTTVCE